MGNQRKDDGLYHIILICLKCAQFGSCIMDLTDPMNSCRTESIWKYGKIRVSSLA